LCGRFLSGIRPNETAEVERGGCLCYGPESPEAGSPPGCMSDDAVLRVRSGRFHVDNKAWWHDVQCAVRGLRIATGQNQVAAATLRTIRPSRATACGPNASAPSEAGRRSPAMGMTCSGLPSRNTRIRRFLTGIRLVGMLAERAGKARPKDLLRYLRKAPKTPRNPAMRLSATNSGRRPLMSGSMPGVILGTAAYRSSERVFANCELFCWFSPFALCEHSCRAHHHAKPTEALLGKASRCGDFTEDVVPRRPSGVMAANQ
jgi:hypothetical protein